MPDQIKCPNCGKNEVELFCIGRPQPHADTVKILSCDNCGCKGWDESKRQPPKITPEMAWNWFTGRILDYDRQHYQMIDKIHIYNGHAIISSIADESEILLTPDIVETMGWQDMPEKRRS